MSGVGWTVDTVKVSGQQKQDRSVTRCVTWPLPRQPLWALILSVGKYAGLAALKKNNYTADIAHFAV